MIFYNVFHFLIGALIGHWAISLYKNRQIIQRTDGEPYLVRYFLWRPDWAAKLGLDSKKLGRIYLHHFLSSDHDKSLHDHPWSFASLILWPGYREIADLRQMSLREPFKWQKL